jgi:hypothetical protein
MTRFGRWFVGKGHSGQPRLSGPGLDAFDSFHEAAEGGQGVRKSVSLERLAQPVELAPGYVLRALQEATLSFGRGDPRHRRKPVP